MNIVRVERANLIIPTNIFINSEKELTLKRLVFNK
jgi:hypothetical protein